MAHIIDAINESNKIDDTHLFNSAKHIQQFCMIFSWRFPDIVHNRIDGIVLELLE